MRIVLVAFWHSEKMGYSDNMLPKAMAAMGHEVHLITSTAQIYFNSPMYQSTYGTYLGPAIVEPGSKRTEGYTLHRLPFEAGREIRIIGLVEKVRELKPDVVQTIDIDRANLLPLARERKRLGFLLFTEMHFHASVFPNYKNRSLFQKLKWFVKIGHALGTINGETTCCYAISEDCADIARLIYEVPAHKVKVQSLGTDTSMFKPITTPEESERRIFNRTALGFSAHDIVCVYTGRITADKGPAVLARAVGELQQKGETEFKALFVGAGEASEVRVISQTPGCVVKDFVPVFELPQYYQAAEIAVWPSQESTSQLDAMACGLPLILNDTIQVMERVNGNGLLYRLMDHHDLASKLIELKSAEKRERMGQIGFERAEKEFSWTRIVRDRINDYQVARQATSK